MTKQGGVDMSDVDEEIGLTGSEIERGDGERPGVHAVS